MITTNKPLTTTEITEMVMSEGAFQYLMRRQEVAIMLLKGASYTEIQSRIGCSSATVADVSKRLQEHGVNL